MVYPKPTTSFGPVDELLYGAISARTIIEATRMKLFDNLQTPCTAKDLAKTMELSHEPLEALLDLFVVYGLLAKEANGYKNAPMTQEYLVTSSPLFQGQGMELNSTFSIMMQDNLSALLRGEDISREQTDEEWASELGMVGTLQHALNGQLQMAAEFIATLPEFAKMRTMADIGGNHGHYSMEILARNPQLHSTLYDLPHVVEPSQKRCDEHGYGKRITCQPLNIQTDALPQGTYDMIFASHVLYSCKKDLDGILSKLHTALKPRGCLILHHFTPAGGATSLYKATTEFLTRLCGYETHYFTQEEFEVPLKKIGFSNFESTLTGMDNTTLLLVARKA